VKAPKPLNLPAAVARAFVDAGAPWRPDRLFLNLSFTINALSKFKIDAVAMCFSNDYLGQF
jgi:hypothetical protein